MAVLMLLALITGFGVDGRHHAAGFGHRAAPAMVFTIVNSALVILKLIQANPPAGFEVPVFMPVLGAVVYTVLLVNRFITGDLQAPMIAAGLLVGVLGLYALMRPEHVEEDDLAAAPAGGTAE